MRRGQVIVMIALLSTFMIALGGMAVDLVLAYTVKTFLATATDAAAMGGVRALERGATYAEQQSEVERVIQLLFDSNFPNGLLLTGNSGRLEQSVAVAGATMDPGAPSMFQIDPKLKPGIREVRVRTVAEAPTFFMRFFGVNSVTVRSSAYAARRDVNVVVVLDRSASLKNAGAWDDVQEAARKFVQKFDNNRDRVGLVTFGTGGNVDYPLSSGFKTNNAVVNLINTQTVPTAAATNSPVGMWLAYSELLRINDPNALNSIVFFTDGQPSAFTSVFKVKNSGTGPKCLSTTEEGTLATLQDTAVWNNPRFYDIRGFWKRQAGPAPVNNGSTVTDAPQNPRCSGFSTSNYDYGLNTELIFNSSQPWPSTWVVSEAGVPAKEFCIKPGAGGCLGTDADFSYSTNDTRLFNESTTTSNTTFRGTNVHNAAKNLILNIAQTARRDEALGGVYIHTIGLGGYGYDADAGLMKRISNDPSNSYGVQIAAADDEPVGSYTYAPNLSEIQAAFDKVRSEVMRLTR